MPYYVKNEGWFFDKGGVAFGPYDSKEAALNSYKNMYKGCDSCEE